jgi:hypothetical protein
MSGKQPKNYNKPRNKKNPEKYEYVSRAVVKVLDDVIGYNSLFSISGRMRTFEYTTLLRTVRGRYPNPSIKFLVDFAEATGVPTEEFFSTLGKTIADEKQKEMKEKTEPKNE